MNGTTRCPLCETRFKITEAQMSAHQGMVRCGHCHHAFDARSSFISHPDTPQPHVARVNPTQELITQSNLASFLSDIAQTETDEASVQNNTALQPEPAISETIVFEPTRSAPEHPESTVPEAVADESLPPVAPLEISLEEDTPPSSTTTEASATPTHDNELDFSHTAHYIDIAAAENTPGADVLAPHSTDIKAETEITTEAVTEAAAQAEIKAEVDAEKIIEAAATSEHDDTIAEPETEENPSETPKRRLTWLWITGCVLLLLVLTGQSIYFLRTVIAAHQPELKPALIAYCQILNCTVSLPQDADLVSIESSGLDADAERENRVNFSALLRNRASYAQAFPMLALTLNDGQDQPLARRLFSPEQYLPATENLQTGFTANHEVNVKLRLNTTDLRASGYRLELFYGNAR